MARMGKNIWRERPVLTALLGFSLWATLSGPRGEEISQMMLSSEQMRSDGSGDPQPYSASGARGGARLIRVAAGGDGSETHVTSEVAELSEQIQGCAGAGRNYTIRLVEYKVTCPAAKPASAPGSGAAGTGIQDAQVQRSSAERLPAAAACEAGYYVEAFAKDKSATGAAEFRLGLRREGKVSDFKTELSGNAEKKAKFLADAKESLGKMLTCSAAAAKPEEKPASPVATAQPPPPRDGDPQKPGTGSSEQAAAGGANGPKDDPRSAVVTRGAVRRDGDRERGRDEGDGRDTRETRERRERREGRETGRSREQETCAKERRDGGGAAAEATCLIEEIEFITYDDSHPDAADTKLARMAASIKKSIRELLNSTREGDFDEGMSRIEDVIRAVKDKGAELGMKKEKEDKIVADLNSLKSLAKANRDVRQLRERTKSAYEDLVTGMRDVRDGNYWAWPQVQQAYKELSTLQNGPQMIQQWARNGQYGPMTRDDFGDLTTNLQQYLRQARTGRFDDSAGTGLPIADRLGLGSDILGGGRGSLDRLGLSSDLLGLNRNGLGSDLPRGWTARSRGTVGRGGRSGLGNDRGALTGSSSRRLNMGNYGTRILDQRRSNPRGLGLDPLRSSARRPGLVGT